jgi:hypothetical protein
MLDRESGGAGMAESGKMNRVRKKRVSEDDKEKKPAHRAELPLKKGGGRIEMVNAHATERELRHLLERDPEHFRALRALVEGRPAEVSKEHLRDLRKWAFVMRDGSIRPAVKAIMTAAVRDTPDGPALVYPLDLSNPEDAATAARVEKEFDKAGRDMPKRIWRDIKRLKDDDDKSPGH